MLGKCNIAGGNTFAYITVNYLPGDICTVTNGSIALRAKDTKGTWTFEIPKAGTWIVNVTNGNISRTETIIIESKNQSNIVYLSNAVYIYNNGTFLTGYSFSEQVAAQDYGTYLGWTGNGSHCFVILPIFQNFLNYNYLKIDVELTIGTSGWCRVGTSSLITYENDLGIHWIDSYSAKNNNNRTYWNIPLIQKNDPLYIKACGWAGSSQTFKLYSIQLVP